MDVREINRLLLTGKAIVARFMVDGQESQARIIRARRHGGVLQGKVLGSGHWVALRQVWQA